MFHASVNIFYTNVIIINKASLKSSLKILILIIPFKSKVANLYFPVMANTYLVSNNCVQDILACRYVTDEAPPIQGVCDLWAK